MCIIWILYQILFLFCYYDMPTLAELKRQGDQQRSITVEGAVQNITSSSPDGTGHDPGTLFNFCSVFIRLKKKRC